MDMSMNKKFGKMKTQYHASKRFQILHEKHNKKKTISWCARLFVFLFFLVFIFFSWKILKEDNLQVSKFVDEHSKTSQQKDASSEEYQKEREKHVQERLDFLKDRVNRGDRLSPPEAFDLQYLSFTNTKSRVDGGFSSDHCSFDGPRTPKGWNHAQEVALMSQLDISKEYLLSKNAQVLSTEHEMCTHKPPTEFTESALVFNDVCLTFNLDSLKMSQRGIIIFDNTNLNKERCVSCPNPQMTKIWGTTECGIMWLHQINSQTRIGDYQECYDSNRKKIKAHGQRQDPGESRQVKGAIYYRDRTLLLNYVQINPGHQVWDFLMSLVKPMEHHLGITHIASHSSEFCDSSIWVCHLLRTLGLFKTPTAEENLITIFPNTLSCFKEIIIPIPGWDHDNDKLSSTEIQRFAFRLHQAYGISSDSVSELSKILLYPHNTPGEAGVRRAWLDIEETMVDLEDKYIVKKVDDFAKVSVQEQVQLFSQHDVLVMSHGGQMANAIFCRKETIIIEVTCGGYSQFGSHYGFFPRALKLFHVIYAPCLCVDGRSDSSNYKLPAEEVFGIVDYVTNTVENYGTQRLKHIKCTGS